MSTSTPDAPTPAFDPHAFPHDLLTAERDATSLLAQLREHGRTLPWSREPHPGFPEVTDRGRERPGKPASPGWTPEQAAEYDRMRAALLSAATTVFTHPWWDRCAAEGNGVSLVEIRQALKRAAAATAPEQGATALGQEDVREAA
ncbi:hypothetical protein LUR56_39790 [Streptomyces sp. MT29]|nr:hypothetical protein [Streptomyces sp. MT29]